MKTLPLFIVNNFKVLFLLALLLHVQSSDVDAQDQDLFEHTWHFEHGELNGESFYPTVNLTADLFFYPNDIMIGYTYCEGGISFENILYEEANLFEILGGSIVLIDYCGPKQENELIFMVKHNSFYLDFQNTGEAINPFSYTIGTIDDYYQLTIENGEGDLAVYNSVLLSITDFSKDSFTLYPNPVKETLHISSTASQAVNVSIYNLNGKLIQRHSFENKTTTLDVRSFNQGLYFIVFETETGKRVGKKFVKK